MFAKILILSKTLSTWNNHFCSEVMNKNFLILSKAEGLDHPFRFHQQGLLVLGHSFFTPVVFWFRFHFFLKNLYYQKDEVLSAYLVWPIALLLSHLKQLYISNKTKCFSYKNGCTVCGQCTCIEAFKRRGTVNQESFAKLWYVNCQCSWENIREFSDSVSGSVTYYFFLKRNNVYECTKICEIFKYFLLRTILAMQYPRLQIKGFGFSCNIISRP